LKPDCRAITSAPEGTLLGPPPEPPRDIEIYDLDEVQQEFVTCSGDVRDIHLLVEGIHCAACVWLIERGLQRVPGVQSANVNLAAKRLHLRWDNQRARLSDECTAHLMQMVIWKQVAADNADDPAIVAFAESEYEKAEADYYRTGERLLQVAASPATGSANAN